jgi:hypothetical protein
MKGGELKPPLTTSKTEATKQRGSRRPCSRAQSKIGKPAKVKVLSVGEEFATKEKSA